MKVPAGEGAAQASSAAGPVNSTTARSKPSLPALEFEDVERTSTAFFQAGGMSAHQVAYRSSARPSRPVSPLRRRRSTRPVPPSVT